MIIRPARPEDYVDFSRLYLEVNDLHAATLPELFQAANVAPFDESEFCRMLETAGQAVYMALVDDQAVGFVNVVLREALPLEILAPRLFAVIDSIGVNARFRQAGIGQALMARAEQWALEQGARSVELNVFDFNQGAIAFYKRQGYNDLSRKMSKRLD